MYPKNPNTTTRPNSPQLPHVSRKNLVDALCQRAYTDIVNGNSFSCANLQNAEFIALYLTLVFGKHFTWVYDSVYYIIPA